MLNIQCVSDVKLYTGHNQRRNIRRSSNFSQDADEGFCVNLVASKNPFTVCGIEERAVINSKAIMRNAPKVGLGRYINFESTAFDGVGLWFVEPLHLLKTLSMR